MGVKNELVGSKLMSGILGNDCKQERKKKEQTKKQKICWRGTTAQCNKSLDLMLTCTFDAVLTFYHTKNNRTWDCREL